MRQGQFRQMPADHLVDGHDFLFGGMTVDRIRVRGDVAMVTRDLNALAEIGKAVEEMIPLIFPHVDRTPIGLKGRRIEWLEPKNALPFNFEAYGRFG